MNKRPLLPVLLATAAVLSPLTSFAAIIGKNNTSASQLDLTNAWVGGVVPGTNDIAAFGSSNTATSGSLNIGNGVSFLGIQATNNTSAGITITNNSTNTTAVMVLGASGIDWSATQQVSGTNRTLNVNSLLVLTNDQSWTAGLGLANTTQITASNVITGPGKLTIAGTSGSTNAAVYLQGSNNTFSGGVTINSNGALRITTIATASGGLVTDSAIGTGPLTINGGTIFGGGSTLATTNTSINGDFAINVGGTNVAINGRFTMGGTMDLGGATRTATLGNYRPASNAITGGNESFRFLVITNTNGGGPAVRVTNGTFRFVRDPSGSASDYVSVNFSQSNNFAAGTGLTIGTNVITTFASGNPFGSTNSNQPHMTVEVGGYFNLSDVSNPRSPSVRSLSGDGIVTSLAASTNTNPTSTLTVNPQAGDSYTFSGRIADGTSFTNLVTNANTRLALIKSGTGTQVLNGSNSYTGNTVVTNGVLELSTNGVLTFDIGGSGTNNAISGTGTAFLRGALSFNLSGASTNLSDSWTIIATNTTKVYDGNFSLAGFTNSGGTWIRGANGVFYQFVQTNGLLTVTTNTPPANPYSNWLTNYPSLTGTNTNATADPEGDGFINQMEFAFGGNPTTGTPALLQAQKSGTNTDFTFIADTNSLTYTVQFTTNLATGPWTNTLVTISNATNQSGVLLTNYVRLQFTVPASGNAFYRVLGVQAP